MIRVLALLFLLLPGVAHAQSVNLYCLTGVSRDGFATWAPASPTNPCPVASAPFLQTGAGSLAPTTSAAINTMTITYGALPVAWTNLVVVDNGSADVAVCVQGGTCTCAENSVASTNGTTIKAGGGGYQFSWNKAAVATPTIVSCTGSATAVDFVF